MINYSEQWDVCPRTDRPMEENTETRDAAPTDGHPAFDKDGVAVRVGNMSPYNERHRATWGNKVMCFYCNTRTHNPPQPGCKCTADVARMPPAALSALTPQGETEC